MYLNDDQEALLDAARDNSLRRVNTLLKKGVDPDFEDMRGNTPLIEAIRAENLGMVKALVAAGADVSRGGSSWEKPIDIADRGGNAKIIDYLEMQGAESAHNVRLSRKQQALFEAAQDGDARKVRTLLDEGIDPDFADDGESTPLDEAIRRGSLATVRALVDAGADINRVNSLQEAPLDLAKQMGHTAIAQYLEGEGAITGVPAKGGTMRPGKSFKPSRGRSLGDDFDDDYYDDDQYYFGADEGAGRNSAPRKTAAPFPAKKASATAAPETSAKPAKPVFREDTLKDIFNAKKWVGKADEMEQLWNEVPKRLHKHFDFAAALAEARRETLKQNAPKKINLTQQQKPAAAKPEMPAAPTPPEPPKPAI